ncbi:MAG: GEVED domain-containing protein, partial [Bacteroidota bacterium]
MENKNYLTKASRLTSRMCFLLIVTLSGLWTSGALAQNANSYTFTTSTGSTLDAMTGATSQLTTGNDDTPSGLLALPFTFIFENNSYTNYSVSPDGWIKFGNVAGSAEYTNVTTSTTNTPKLFPYWDDLATGTTGNVKTLVTGTSPNRIFKIQWFVTIPRNTIGAANSTFQAWLYETTKVIEFRYGTMGVPSTGSISGGIGGLTASNFHGLTFSSNTSSAVTANDLNSTTPASGRMYTYTPPAGGSYCTTGLYATGCSSSDNIQNISVSNLSQTATGCTGGTGIADYTGTTVNFTQNTTYPFTITCDYSSSEYTGWWVDLNNNGSFADAGEFIGSSGPGGTTITGNVTIPSGAATGTHRMRVRLVYGTAQSLTTSCTAYTYGETHDYTANISAGVSYCTTGLYTTGCSSSDNIQNISVSNLSQTATGCTGGTGIADYTGTTVNFSQNTTYPFTITCDYSSSEYTGWWVDLNNNGSFGDAGEFIGSSGPGGTTITGNVTIPSGAATGTHRMRVRLVYNTAQSLSTSCTAYTYGETHDYTCNITAGCTQPTTQATIGAYTNNTTGTSVTVNWTRGNGNNVLVVARLTATTGVDPTGGTLYSSPSTVFGSGSTTGTGNFAVYNSTGTSVTVTGLTAGSSYTFTCYEYNTTGTCYKTPGSSSAVTITNPPPANDNAANAINIASLPYTSAIISNATATDDYTSSTCDGPYKNVWWTVTGICGTMTAITCTGGTNFDDEMAVFTGSPGSFVEVICNDDNGAGCTSNYAGASWTATAGTVYYISVGSYYVSGVTGNLQLNVTATPFTSSVTPTG